MEKLIKNKKGVFGLTAVQSFFAIIFSIALLAYIIIIIMGSLGDTTVLSQSSASVINETSAYVNSTGYTLDSASISGFSNPTITGIINNSDNYTISVGNASVSSEGVVTNATSEIWEDVLISYTYNYNTVQQNNLDSILTNTSNGVTGFFSSINPVYAILAVLVIILVLVVLVRVVQNPNKSGNSPQL